LNRPDAFAFLSRNQPMPSETEAGSSLLQTFDQVRRFFISQPDPACIPLFLGAFADDMGGGVYQLCDDLFACFDQSELTPHLADAMRSPHKGVRWWAAHWAAQFSDPELFRPLCYLVGSSSEPDAHVFALNAICAIYVSTNEPEVGAFLRRRATVESDPELRQDIETTLGIGTSSR